MLTLANLAPQEGSRKPKKRVGRGPGSGHGKTSGRGHKGAKARSGYQSKPGFEGGQMPLQRRLPKRGFNNIFRKQYEIIGLGQLDAFEAGQEISTETLVAAGLAKAGNGVKILANGEISKALTVKVEKVSGTARELIEKAGGTVVETAVSGQQG
ncbi:MAG: 50S ribosomal protein L15 [Desulfobulbaceae bacterium]|uniref:Large ribosomal subunit protein uL15 n=1 Tax=Desulfofustis glycolicus DSM 9705 TaxID=1121409 RepID=A0A1M5Y4X1_9BACT|nr:50S ribosomal protein L15 [Desulfobulbaceae bacterium]SHI07087.1 LSU ribosomal protein L15P [Desulfofustis glycolicus DSM 9705]